MIEWEPELLTKILFSEDKEYETVKKNVYECLDETVLMRVIDTNNCDRILNSVTASTSTGSSIVHALVLQLWIENY